MAKLRHVSLHTADPEKTAEFYKRVFDMVEVGRTDSKFAGGIFLSAGTINLSVVRFKTKEAADRGDGLGLAFGSHHFVFWVENEDETRHKLREAGAEGKPGWLDYVSEFVEEAKASGLVQKAIDRAGPRGTQVGPPGNPTTQQ